MLSILRDDFVLKEEEKPHLIAALAIKGLGRRTLYRLLLTLRKHKHSFDDFWANKGDIWSKISLNKKQVKSIKNFIKENSIYSKTELLQDQGVRVIYYGTKLYPAQLKVTADPPLALFVKVADGAKSDSIQRACQLLGSDRLVAVVGTRRMTAYGQLATRRLVHELVASGQAVVSGFMYGVDVTAQRFCLQAGGVTIGVLGFGFQHCYPISHRSLMKKMLEKGAVFVSEYYPDVRPQKATFAERNRLIAGLSWATVVVEAARQSGSHITAQCALDEGRVVAAVPGPITSPYSEGTKWLINQGAVLASGVADLFSQRSDGFSFYGQNGHDRRNSGQYSNSQQDSKQTNKLNQAIYQALSQAPMTFVELQQLKFLSILTTAQLNAALSMMEVDGSIMRNGQHYEARYR